MEYNDFPNFLKEFNQIRSFAGKIRYANEHLKRIGGGSGRIAYEIDKEKVFKLAKNAKGIAQNEAEASAGAYGDYDDILTNVYDYPENNAWIVAERAKKINEKRFKEITGFSIDDVYRYVRNFDDINHGKVEMFHIDPELKERLDNDEEFVQRLTNFTSDYSQNAGDMGRASTYGEVLRDGMPSVVLTDYGLSHDVYDTHYNPSRSQRYQMYELFGFKDGNDDILSDTGDSGDIRRGMVAQMPYSVSDGTGVINESFIKFVSGRNKYPKKEINGLPYLTDCFHECVNNIKETLKHVDNKKHFYTNLLSLQEYLKEQGYYNRDSLLMEDTLINEEHPSVERYSLEDKVYANQLGIAIVEKLKLGNIQKNLGGGANGFAFEINNNLVMKITADVSEADAALISIRSNPKTLAKIFNMYKVVDTDKNLSFIVILQENILNKPIEKFNKMEADIEKILPDFGLVGLFSAMRLPKKFNYDELIKLAESILTVNPEANVSELDRKNAYNFMLGLIEIRKELIELGIKSKDYVTKANLGYKDGVLKFFDVGGYRAEEPYVADNEVILLPEGEINEEGIAMTDKFTKEAADKVANKIKERDGYSNLQYKGAGNFGFAYDIGSNRILKVTSDKSEVVECLKIKGKDNKYLANIFNVYEIKPKEGSVLPHSFVIILEKLKTNIQYFNRMIERLNYAFTNILDINFNGVVDDYVQDEYSYKKNKEKIDKYLSTNEEDAKFYYDLLAIADEAKANGIESADYYNTNNLGYKKNGNLGFFDMGFGDYVPNPDNPPTKIEVDEDGSSKFSTDSEMGQDGFPPYNNGLDSSPMIQNDLNANSAMYNENVQQMEKQYVKTGKFDEQDKKNVIEITGGDNYTKRIADFYDVFMGISNPNITKNSEEQYQKYYKRTLIEAYDELKNYNKNVIPIKDFENLYPLDAWSALKKRKDIINTLRDLPSVFLRNLKPEIRKERHAEYELQYKLPNLFQKIKQNLNLIGNLSDDKKNTIYNKIFSSKNVTFEQIADQLEKTEILFLNHNDDIDGIRDNVKYEADTGEAKILHDDGNILVVDVMSSDAMKSLGCGSQWCFATEHSTEHWGTYADSSHVNVIYNFKLSSDARNRMVVVLPDGGVYDMYNDQMEDGYEYLDEISVTDYINVGYEAVVNEMMNKLMSEDLEYNHVKGDATDDKYKLGESMLSFSKSDYQRLSNEDAIKYFEELNDFEKKTKNNEYLSHEDVSDIYFIIMSMYYNKERYSSLFSFDTYDDKFHYFHKILKDWNFMNEDRKKAWIPGSKAVTVKKKCRLGGNPDGTSVACNQGDINNLEFSSLNETEIMQLKDLPFKDEVENRGGKIFSVGGAVRDEFLGKESKDLDILITGIPMDELEELLSKYGRVDKVGASFGVLKFKPEGSSEEIDIAIPRTETATGEGGHKGFDVSSDHTLPIEDDLLRRDFTINAIAKDVDGNLIDPYNGQEDLKNKIIRIVNPVAFADDPLRMLRAVQFASRFGFTIEPKTMELIKKNAEKIKEIPPERILIEFDKIIKKGNKLMGAQLLQNTGLFKQIFGFDLENSVINNSNFNNVQTMGEFIYLMTSNMSNPAEFYKNNLKGDIDTYKEIKALEIAFNAGEETNQAIARTIAHNMYMSSPESLNSKVIPNTITIAAQELLAGRYPKSIGELAINGNDLMKLGLKGKEIGDMLKSLLMKVYTDKIRNNREELLSLAQGQENDNVNEGFGRYEDNVWIVNGQEVDKWFFVKAYDDWNQGGYSDPSKASVLEFLQNNYEDFSHDEILNNEIYWALTDRDVLNESKKSKYSKEKASLMRSKTISKEMKEEILKYFGGGSTYHEGGRVHGLKIPKVKGKRFHGVSLGADKNGFYCYTHRAASKRYKSPDKISQKDIDFIETTG